ncbi:MAG: phosphoribosyltransferase [Chitinophagia bacterium]|nr:phosphoribosyltransferase [Chitinophagia bacterium]
MEKKRILILDSARIDLKLKRMAYEIWEHNSEESELVFVGVEGAGMALATNLANLLGAISPIKVSIYSLLINKKQPLNHALDTTENLSHKVVILIDDVANSGKTLTYSLPALLNFDLKKVMVAVLVDRKHKSFPIACDIVGHTLSTTLQEHIEVEIEGTEIKAVYLE